MEFVVPILIVCMVIGAIAVGNWVEKNRREKIRQTAEQLGIEYRLFLDESDNLIFSEFALSSLGRSGHANNVLIADSGELRMVIFDYQYTTGSGKNRRTHKQTVALVRSQSLEIPEFQLRPEGFFHSIASLFGFTDINFQTDPAFSNAYQLKGNDEPKIRTFFNDERRARLLQVKGVTVEGKADKFLFYQAGVRRNLEKIKSLMEQAHSLYALFRTQDTPE